MAKRKEWVIETSKGLFIWYICVTEGVMEIKDIEKQYSLFSEKLEEMVKKMGGMNVDEIYDVVIDILRMQNEFNAKNGFETMDEHLFKNEIQMAYPGKGLLGAFGGVWVTNKVDFGKELGVELYKGLSKGEYMEMMGMVDEGLKERSK